MYFYIFYTFIYLFIHFLYYITYSTQKYLQSIGQSLIMVPTYHQNKLLILRIILPSQRVPTKQTLQSSQIISFRCHIPILQLMIIIIIFILTLIHPFLKFSEPQRLHNLIISQRIVHRQLKTIQLNMQLSKLLT